VNHRDPTAGRAARRRAVAGDGRDRAAGPREGWRQKIAVEARSFSANSRERGRSHLGARVRAGTWAREGAETSAARVRNSHDRGWCGSGLPCPGPFSMMVGMFIRLQRGGNSPYGYLVIVENRRVRGRTRQRVIGSLGRLDRLVVDGRRLDQLMRSLTQVRERLRRLGVVRPQPQPDAGGSAGVGAVAEAPRSGPVIVELPPGEPVVVEAPRRGLMAVDLAYEHSVNGVVYRARPRGRLGRPGRSPPHAGRVRGPQSGATDTAVVSPSALPVRSSSRASRDRGHGDRRGSKQGSSTPGRPRRIPAEASEEGSARREEIRRDAPGWGEDPGAGRGVKVRGTLEPHVAPPIAGGRP
jgi:hypothetical protein